MHIHSDGNPNISLPESLNQFLKHNPDSSLKPIPLEEHLHVVRPWNDETISLLVCPEDIGLIESLNQLILPSQLTAIYHIDTKLFEFIFSVRPETDELWNREFDFIYKGNTVHCRYSESSPRLLGIAAQAIPSLLHSPTDHRNLRIFCDYCNQDDLPEQLREFFENRKPMSFFLGPLDYSMTDNFIDMLRHLNFYMFYVDRDSPQIVIHNPEDANAAIFDEGIKEDAPFPSSLIASPLDSYILDLWGAAQRATTRLAFLYYYQILEYAAFYFVDDQVKQSITRTLRRPDIISALDTCLPLLLDQIIEIRQSDEAKLVSVIKRSVDSGRIWDIVAKYELYFSQRVEFDGGVSVDALIKQFWTVEDFKTAWIPKLPDTLRHIRNALVHSREQRLGQAIAPTQANSSRLVPWTALIEEVACQVAMYRNF